MDRLQISAIQQCRFKFPVFRLQRNVRQCVGRLQNRRFLHSQNQPQGVAGVLHLIFREQLLFLQLRQPHFRRQIFRLTNDALIICGFGIVAVRLRRFERFVNCFPALIGENQSKICRTGLVRNRLPGSFNALLFGFRHHAGCGFAKNGVKVYQRQFNLEFSCVIFKRIRCIEGG